MVILPLCDAFVIRRTPFVVDDERRNIIPEALLKQNESANAPVAVIKGTDLLKAYMELKDILQPHDRQLFIPLQQFEHLRVDCKGTGAGLLLLAAVYTRLHLFSALCIGAVVQFPMKPYNQVSGN